MLDYIKKLITPDMVSLWVPAGQNGARDLIRGNHGTAFGTHPNVPVLPNLINPSVGWVFGGDDYVNLGSDESLNPGTNDIALGAYIKRTAISSAIEYIYIKRQATLKWYNLSLASSNRISAQITINHPTIPFSAVLSTTAIIDTNWYLVGVSFDRDGNGQVFINGEPDGSAVDISAHAGNCNPSSNANMGGRGINVAPVSADWLNGYVALPFLAKEAWSEARWQNFYNATKGLFAPRG